MMNIRVGTLFILALMLFSPVSYAAPQIAEKMKTAPAPVEIPTQENMVIQFQAFPGGGGICSLSSLTDLEVQRLKDTVYTPGLVGNEISSGLPPNTNREAVSDSNTLLVPNPFDSETAFQKEVPNQVLSPQELSPLQNQSVKGPFAFGLSLDDTVRAARCLTDGPCAVDPGQLEYRNSGEGITGNVQNIYENLAPSLNNPNNNLSEEDRELLLAQLETERVLNDSDTNEILVEGYSRVANPNLMNHIRADNTISAGLLTNCDDGHCVLTLYSMFDKYFNAWFSGEMVVSTFAPTLWGRFQKMLLKSNRDTLLNGKLTEKLDVLKLWKSKNLASKVKNSEEILKPSKFLETRGFDGVNVVQNARKVWQSNEETYKFFSESFGQKQITSSGGFPAKLSQAFGEKGAFTSITDFEERKKIFAAVGKLREYSNAAKAIDSQLKKEIERAAALGNTAEAAAIKIDVTRNYMNMAFDWDDTVSLDMADYIRSQDVTRFNGLFVKDAVTGQTVSLGTGDMKYFGDGITKNFIKDGDFSKVANVQKDAANNILIFERRVKDPLGPVDTAKVAADGYPAGTEVLLSNGTFVPATKANLSKIEQDFKVTGELPQTVTTTDVPRPNPLTPQEFADNILAGFPNPVATSKFSTITRHIDDIHNEMVIRDWGRGNYTNVLSKALQSQENLVQNYFKLYTPEGGLVWTARMYGYWWLTKGAGLDNLSIYQLPDEWTEVSFETGGSEVYNDAYVDFFANEGSDTGDLFQRVISKFPVPVILDRFAEEYEPLNNAWNFVAGETGRTAPDNLAMFMFGGESCPECTTAIVSPDTGRFDVQYISPESTNAFFLEHGKSEAAKEEGQLLLLFAHRMNVTGQVKGEELETLDIVQARENGTTCEQVVEKLPVYGWAAKVIGAERAGAAIAITENVSYYAGGLMGIMVTAANQLFIAPEMNECVDDQEGYFASLYVPHQVKKTATDELQKSVSTNALDGVRAFAEQVDQNSNDNSLANKVLKESTSKVRELVDQASNNGVGEAQLRVQGSSSGYLKSNAPLYFWVGGDSLIQPNRYITDGKTVVATEDGHTITLDNTTGMVTVDGQEVISADSADHTRLATKDLTIPAIEIPQRLNLYTLPDTNQVLFTVNVRGETIVLDPALLNCIQQAVFEQSGVGLNSNNMSEAFGLAESVSTDAFPTIAIDQTRNRILMSGRSSQTADGPSASIQVYGNRNVIVTGTQFPEAGKFQSMLLENGSLVYKPATNEIVIWLRHHESAIVSDDEVRDFAGSLTSTQNPNTLCDEPAIDLRVETDPATPATKLKGDNLTAGLQKNGPFQVFETDSKRFILYSKLVDGECQDYFKVINKDTGEEYDQAIDSIVQNEDGTIRIRTSDGLDHELSFTDQNGKPVITYDGQSEVLLSASGKGGSFYYDPNRGLYFAENGQFIPLQDNFKNQGLAFQANPDGSVSGKAGSNVFNINTGQSSPGLFNIPSLPESFAGIAVVMVLVSLICAGFYLDSRTRKKKNNPHA